MGEKEFIAKPGETVLVTGAGGFIGRRVVESLLREGCTHIRCLVRSETGRNALNHLVDQYPHAQIEIVSGNLLSRRDCFQASRDVAVVYHLAAGNEKSFAGCFMNSVVTTRNLLEAAVASRSLKRFVHVSSFAVYSNAALKRNALLDESCALETDHVRRNEPYAYAKLKQEEIVREYAATSALPYVILRPGAVYGPGLSQLTGRIGLGTFGIFLHLGGANQVPFTYVENCADAIARAGLMAGIDGEVFNVVDDDMPTSRQFFRHYRKSVAAIRYIPVPYRLFYAFCWLWEQHCRWSHEQLPPAFNPRKCETYWKGNRYSNRRLKERVGWQPRVSFEEGSGAYFEFLRKQRAC